MSGQVRPGPAQTPSAWVPSCVCTCSLGFDPWLLVHACEDTLGLLHWRVARACVRCCACAFLDSPGSSYLGSRRVPGFVGWAGFRPSPAPRSATELLRIAAARGKRSPWRRDYLVRRLVDGTLDFGTVLRFVVGSSVGSSAPPSDPCRCWLRSLVVCCRLDCCWN